MNYGVNRFLSFGCKTKSSPTSPTSWCLPIKFPSPQIGTCSCFDRLLKAAPPRAVVLLLLITGKWISLQFIGMKLEERNLIISRGFSALRRRVVSTVQSLTTLLLADRVVLRSIRILSRPLPPPAGKACGEGYYFQMPLMNSPEIDDL